MLSSVTPRSSRHSSRDLEQRRRIRHVSAAGVALILAVWASGASISQAQTPAELAFDAISTADGLPSVIVESVIQDGTGFVWIGTQGGLDRYDGVRHHVFPVEPRDSTALADEFIYVVYESPKGSGIIWVGTNSGGLHRYDPETGLFRRYQHDPDDPETLRHNSVRAIVEDLEGRLWVGTYGGGLHRVNPKATTVARFGNLDDPDSNYITQIYAFPSFPERLWCVTRGGLRVFDTASSQYAELHLTGRADALQSFSVTSIAALQHNPEALWVGTGGGGLFEMHVRERADRSIDLSLSRQFMPGEGLASNQITVLRRDEKRPGHLWIGTVDEGLQSFDPRTSTGPVYRYDPDDAGGISHNNIRDIYQDESGLLWVATWSGGLSRQQLPPRFRAIRHNPRVANSPPPGSILYIYEAPSEPDIVWLATMNSGLSRWNRKSDQYTHYFTDSAHQLRTVSVVFEDSSRQFWLGVRGDALYLVDRERGEVERISLDSDSESGYQMFIHESPRQPGVLWIGTMYAGLYAFDIATRRLVNQYRQVPGGTNSLSANEVWALHEDEEGIFWIGTGGGGLSRFDRSTGRFVSYRHDPDDPTTISSDRIVTIAEDSLGFLWLGTSDRGLNRFDPHSGRVQRYTRADGLPDTEVGGLVKDSRGMLWLATNNGLARLDPIREHITVFTEADGIHGPVYHYRARTRTQSGEIILGGPNGAFDIFHPDSVFINTSPPAVALTNVLVDGEPYTSIPSRGAEQPTLSLTYFENDLAFEFAALDFIQPFKNQYRVLLEGADREWSAGTTQPFVRYANLAPGNYTFRVMAANNDGYWSQSDASIGVRIHPPYWQTWWFRLLLAGIALGMIAGAYQYRIVQMRRVERARQRIADDLHDDIGSKISNVALRLDLFQRLLPIGDQERKQLIDLSLTARNVVDDLRDTVWIVDSGHDHLSNLVARMEQTAGQMLQGRRYTFVQPEHLPDVVLPMEPRRHLFLLFKESLHNAVRHSRATRVDIRIEYAAGVLTLSVVDDGVGFDPPTVKAGRGLRTIRTRATEIGAELDLESSPERGTAVSVRMRIE